MVGELLPLEAVRDIKAPNLETAVTLFDLDLENLKKVAMHAESFVVVRKVFHELGNLYIPPRRNYEGLYRILKLSSANKANMLGDYLLFYPEWVVGRGALDTATGSRLGRTT